MKSDILIICNICNKNIIIKMFICNGNKIHDLDYDVKRHWIHLNIRCTLHNLICLIVFAMSN